MGDPRLVAQLAQMLLRRRSVLRPGISDGALAQPRVRPVPALRSFMLSGSFQASDPRVRGLERRRRPCPLEPDRTSIPITAAEDRAITEA